MQYLTLIQFYSKLNNISNLYIKIYDPIGNIVYENKIYYIDKKQPFALVNLSGFNSLNIKNGLYVIFFNGIKKNGTIIKYKTLLGIK